MRTKDEFHRLVLNLRKIAADPKYLTCSCPKTACKWHGRCAECVAIHRYGRDHVPNCFQQFINEKLKSVASIGEMEAVEKGKTPAEYWDYVRQMDAGADEAKSGGNIEFRGAVEADLPRLLAIYDHYLETTTATFDWFAMALDEFKQRICFGLEPYRTFIVDFAGAFAGFCFFKRFSPKPASAKTAEIGLYLKPELVGRGLGRSIVAYLEAAAREKGIETLIASVSDENEASLKLFARLGWRRCAHYRGVGEKFGRKVGYIDFQKEI